MSKVSVAMTTYNGERYIVKLLQSLFIQTRQADEVVICDDCSQDATLSIIQKFIRDNGLQNWFLYQNQKNLGFVENFRQALSLTTGEIVYLCDQDDIWQKNKIERMTDIMEKDLSISALVCSYCLIDGEDNRITNYGKKFYSPVFEKENTLGLSPVEYGPVLYYNIAQGCAGAYRRKLVDTFCSVDDYGSIPHDWALNLMAYQEKGLYYLNKELLLYRIHNHNTIGISDSGTSRIFRLQKYVIELESALNLPLPETAKKEIYQIVQLTKTRITWLREKHLTVWVRGLLQHAYALKQYFFWQYMKDFVLVILRKIPTEK